MKKKTPFVQAMMQEILDLVFEKNHLDKLNLLGWNILELIDLFFTKRGVLRYLLKSDISYLQKFFVPQQLAQINGDVAYYFFTEEGRECLEKNYYSITNILNRNDQLFNKNFILLHDKKSGLELLKNNKIQFEDLEFINHDVLYALLTENSCQIVVGLNLISTTSFGLGYSKRALISYCDNLLIAMSEELFKIEDALWFVNNKYELFKEFISSNDGLNLLRSKQFNIERLKTFDRRLFNDGFNGKLALIIKESITKKGLPNYYLNRIGKHYTNFDENIDLASHDSLFTSRFTNTPILIELFNKLEPKARRLIDIEILIKVIEKPKGLLTIIDGLITLDEINSDFDIDFELSEEMLEAKRATKNISRKTLTFTDLVNDTEETDDIEDEEDENQADDADADADADADQSNTSDDEDIDMDESFDSKFNKKSP